LVLGPLNRAIFYRRVISETEENQSRMPCGTGIIVMKSLLSKKAQYSRLFKPFMTSGILFVTAVSPLFALSSTAHAGLFSFMSSIVSEEASAQTDYKVEPRSSSTNVLQAAVNTDPNPNKVAYVPPVEGNFLVADLVPDATGGPEDTNTQISIYTVRAGDSLSEIAQMFNVSVNTIMWANSLAKASSIQPGQTLIILPVSGIKYTIQKGDTVRGIASKYKADLDEILNYNGISLESTLAVGTVIIIPDAEMQAVTPTKSSGASVPSGYYSRPVKVGYRSQGVHGHNGVDLAAPVGTPIYASAAGKVIATVSNGNWNGGYGNYVIISHANGTQTLYAHNAKNFVTLGQQVAKGDKIASIGMTGKTTGPHVHFEIRGAKNPF
jgi:LysM repeat protein